MWQQHLELFPAEFRKGFKLHDSYRSIKQALCLRRIKRKATGAQLSAKCILCLTHRKHWPIGSRTGLREARVDSVGFCREPAVFLRTFFPLPC
jgi:hypothetical protein